MDELPEKLPVTEDDIRRAEEAADRLVELLKAAEGKPRPPVYSPGKFTEPLGLDAHGNLQKPLTPEESAANQAAREGRRVERPRVAGSGTVPFQPSRRERVLGGLLGLHAGDALGATLEFMPWEEVRRRYPDGLRDITGGGPFGWPRGHATDDTDLTRAVLLAYLDRDAGRLPDGDVVRAAADHMLDWLHGNWPDREPGSSPVDIGTATLTGLRRYQQTRDPRRAGAGPGHAGNGSLMRCLPTALATTDPRRRIHESLAISAITHDDPRCTIACAAYNEIAAALLDDATPTDAIAIGHHTATTLGSPDVAHAIDLGRHLNLTHLVRHGPTGLHSDAGGYVLDSLTLAVTALLDGRSYTDVTIDIVRLGKDTDTNAAFAGGLLGIRDSSRAISPLWTLPLQYTTEFTRAADRLTSRQDHHPGETPGPG